MHQIWAQFQARMVSIRYLYRIVFFILLARATRVINIDLRSRQQWQNLTSICRDRAFKSCDGVNRSQWTDASRTEFVDFQFELLGAWSSFTLRTYNYYGQKRTTGGDSWYLVLRDGSYKVPTRVFDNGDGTYDVAFHLLKPSEYTIYGRMWYSSCHGLQEPKGELNVWFRQVKEKDHCYVGSRVKYPGLIKVPLSMVPPSCMRLGCSQAPSPGLPFHSDHLGRTYRTEMYFVRQNNTLQSCQCCKPAFPLAARPTSRFLFYGDSTIRNSWQLLQYMARQPCKVVFRPHVIHDIFIPKHVCPRVSSLAEVDQELDRVLKRCTAGAPWTSVAIGTNTFDISKNHPLSMLFNMSNFVYNDTYARHHIPAVQLPVQREFTFIYVDGWGVRNVDAVTDTLKNVRPGDVLVLNFGAHYIRTHSFEQWKQFVDALSKYMKELIDKHDIPIIWRTSFVVKEHVSRNYTHANCHYDPHSYFHTDHRRLLFDSYAEHVLLPLGVHIWDVYGISAMGDYVLNDMTHADAATTWAMNTDMMDLFACRE